MPSEINLIDYAQYRQWLVAISPPWLQSQRGRALMEGLGAGLDEHVSWLATGVAARYADRAPEDALLLIGAERLLARYPGEPEGVFRARVLGAWEFWGWAGTAYGMRAALGQLGYNSAIVPVRVYDSQRWAEFDVYLYPAGRSYDGSAEERGRILAVINQIKPGHAKVGTVKYVPTGPLTWDPPNLTWNPPGEVWGAPPIVLYP